MTTLSEDSNSDLSVVDLLKSINVKDVIYMIAESWSKISESILIKSWWKLWSPHKRTAEGEAIITVEETATAVEEADFSVDNFVTSFKCISGCLDVDLEDIKKWLAADKELQQETLSDDEIIGAVADVTQDNDDSDIDDPKATPIRSHTDGAEPLEIALCYVEQEASVSSIDVKLLKKWRNYAVSYQLPVSSRKKNNNFFL